MPGQELLQHDKKNQTKPNQTKQKQQKNPTNKQTKKTKEEELEVVSTCRVTEAWWESSHDWSTVMSVYRFFRKHRLGMGGREIMLYAEEQPD